MSENEDDSSLERTPISSFTPQAFCLSAKSRTSVKLNEKPSCTRGLATGSGGKHEKNIPLITPVQWDVRNFQKSSNFSKSAPGEVLYTSERARKGSPKSDKKNAYPDQEYVVSDCWKSNSDEFPVQLVEPFKGVHLDDTIALTDEKKFSEVDKPIKSPPYTKEFHVLTEVQKAKILKTVEDVVKKLANEECSYVNAIDSEGERRHNETSQYPKGKVYLRKFSLPWVVIKVIEMILCHVIQVIFLSEESYYERKGDFLPIVFTYYLTLFIILLSLVTQLTCFSYGQIQNPCYFMGVVSSCILTLITSLGIIIMLSSMQYYKNFHQVLVLVFVGILICVLFAELCLFYVEVKNIWNLVIVRDQFSD